MSKYKIFISLLAIMCFFSFISAESSIGQRQNAQIDVPYIISQPCATCTYINITILTKDGIVLENTPMVNNGSTWIYSFTPNNSLRHDVNGVGDKDGVEDSFAFWFDATLSGQQTNNTMIVSDIILLLAIMGIILLINNLHRKTDFQSWNNNVVNNKNTGMMMANGFIYGLFKNVFIWFYFLGWILILILKDIVYRFNSAEIYEYFTLVASIYSLGLLLVIIYMVGWFYNYMKETISVLSENNWGVNER